MGKKIKKERNKEIKLGVLVFFLFFFFSFFLTPFAQADDTCECWCGQEGVGAGMIGSFTGTECQSECWDNGFRFVACARSAEEAPTASIRCWTQEECLDSGGGASWESNYPAECAYGPPQESFCYPEPMSVPLGILMGSPGNEISEVTDLGQYVAALYDWMYYAALIIAVIMIMVGGVEYMMAAGRKEMITKAGKRITSAIVGVVLLMSAYTLLATVNPKLVLLEVPQIPMVKSIAYIEEGMNCSWLVEKGYVIEAEGYTFCDKNKSKHTGTCTSVTDVNCGVKGDILSGPEGGGATAEYCFFMHCPEDDEGCMFPANSNEASTPECFACGDIYPDNPKAPDVIDERLCSSIQFEAVNPGTAQAVYRECVYTESAGFAGLDVLETLLDGGRCALLTIDCSEIDSCRDYDKVKVKSESTTKQLECVAGPGGGYDESTMRSVCQNDRQYCNVAPKNMVVEIVNEDTGEKEKTSIPHQSCIFVEHSSYNPISVAVFGTPGFNMGTPNPTNWECVNFLYDQFGCTKEDGSYEGIPGLTKSASCEDVEGAAGQCIR
jgi:hypothetical protein